MVGHGPELALASENYAVGNVTVGVTPEVLRTVYNINSAVGHEPNNAQAC